MTFAGHTLTLSHDDVSNLLRYDPITGDLIWLLTHKEWPSETIDHINGCRDDNRLANLRAVSHSINSRNSARQRRNTSGYAGVWWHKKAKKWVAEVHFDRAKHSLGLFVNKEDAAQIVQSFRNAHGFTQRHGQLS